MAFGVIYLLIDGTNDLEYVGQTIHSMKVRFKKHMRTDSYIGKAIREHGAENFVIAILKECANQEELNYWEKHFIKWRNTKFPNGYNLTSGGAGSEGITDETRAKLSAMRKGVPKSPEHRRKIGVAHRGKQLSDETREKISVSRTGKKHSKETIARMSAERMGDKNAFFNKHHTSKTRMTISAANRHETPYKNLLAEMEKRQLSYNNLAKLLAISQPSISNKMRGKYNFTECDTAKLEEIFGLPAEYLLARDDGENAVSKKHQTPYKNLLAEMKKRQLTYGKLAELLEISQPTLSEKMHGKYKFTERDKAKLVEIFGLPAEYLLAI